MHGLGCTGPGTQFLGPQQNVSYNLPRVNVVRHAKFQHCWSAYKEHTHTVTFIIQMNFCVVSIESPSRTFAPSVTSNGSFSNSKEDPIFRFRPPTHFLIPPVFSDLYFSSGRKSELSFSAHPSPKAFQKNKVVQRRSE